jgi:hypothetical protein
MMTEGFCNKTTNNLANSWKHFLLARYSDLATSVPSFA